MDANRARTLDRRNPSDYASWNVFYELGSVRFIKPSNHVTPKQSIVIWEWCIWDWAQEELEGMSNLHEQQPRSHVILHSCISAPFPACTYDHMGISVWPVERAEEKPEFCLWVILLHTRVQAECWQWLHYSLIQGWPWKTVRRKKIFPMGSFTSSAPHLSTLCGRRSGLKWKYRSLEVANNIDIWSRTWK